MSSPVEDIKAKLSITEVVGSYLKLEKAGVNYKARCPFHNERTPSFFVSPARQTFHCFGCNRGGDIFAFVQEIEGQDFVGALKVLAERAGVEIERSALASNDALRNKLFEILATARNYYAAELSQQPAVLDYLVKRGLTKETIKNWRLGFAPAGWQGLYLFLKNKGYLDRDMEAVGLVLCSTKSGGRRYYDRFRERIMFPLDDSSGRTVGFSGRIFGPERANEGKYVNSPQTTLYDKSKILYGFDRAKLAIRQAEAAVIVEGQMDLLMSHQVGVSNVVAVSGTALTGEHLNLLRRLTEKVIMAFDADSAGVAASRKALELALAAGLEVRVAELPVGSDPAELIRQSPATWERAVKESKHVIDFALAVARRHQSERRELAHLIRREVYPLVARLAHRVDQAYFVSKIAQLIGLPEEVVRADVAEIKVAGSTKEIRDEAQSVSRLERIERKLAGLYWWRPELVKIKLERLWPEKKEELLLEAEISNGGKDEKQITREVRELIDGWEKEKLRLRLQEAMSRLVNAEAAKDELSIAKYLKECHDISRKLNDSQ